MRKYLLALTALLAILPMSAKLIGVDEAKELVNKFVRENSRLKSLASGGDITLAYTEATNAVANYYVYNLAQGGFVIVSADDRVGGVLGYSDQGRLDTANMPAPMKALLDGYVRAVEAVRVDSVSVTPAYARPPKAYVKPLVSAKWSQEYPYNYYTPRSCTSGKPTYTGCTITAAAQMLSAHK